MIFVKMAHITWRVTARPTSSVSRTAKSSIVNNMLAHRKTDSIAIFMLVYLYASMPRLPKCMHTCSCFSCSFASFVFGKGRPVIKLHRRSFPSSLFRLSVGARCGADTFGNTNAWHRFDVFRILRRTSTDRRCSCSVGKRDERTQVDEQV